MMMFYNLKEKLETVEWRCVIWWQTLRSQLIAIFIILNTDMQANYKIVIKSVLFYNR
jgi:hypothetical protein